MKISLLVPTRKRPEQLKRFVESVFNNATHPKLVEVVVYIDNDDDSYTEELPIKIVRGERIVLSQMWNECQKQATGEIYGHMGDDIIIQTKGWDELVRNEFKKQKDRILFVHGDDGYWKERFGTHGFIHKKWVETVGYFVPPYFSSDYNDSWLNDVANGIGRRVYISELYTEHMHFAFNKGTMDETHRERLERHRNDNVDALYKSKELERQTDMQKLREVMK